MVRLILSIIGGMVLAIAVVFATDALSHTLSTSTPPADPNDREAMRAYVAAIPFGILLTMVLGWALAGLAGAGFAARFGRRGQWPGWVVTSLLLLATVGNFAMITHPTWMVVTSLVLIGFAGWLGARLASRATT